MRVDAMRKLQNSLSQSSLNLVLILFLVFVTASILTIEILGRFHWLSAGVCQLIFIIYLSLCITYFLKITPTKKFKSLVPVTVSRYFLYFLNIFALFGTLAFKPNNWDSMTYHLPRIEHWLSSHSLASYPTDISRQIWEPPFGDYLTLVPRTIFGNDNFDGIFSFISLVILEISIYVCLQRLKVSCSYRDVCIMLALTPIVVLEATTTQVDLRASAIALSGVALFFSNDCKIYLFAGLAFAVATGIKVTSVIPLLALFLLPEFIARLKRGPFLRLLIITLFSFSLNLPWLYRNFVNFGSISGPATSAGPDGFSVLKIALSPGLLLARFFGFIFSNLGQPVLHQLNSLLLRSFSAILGACKIIDFPSSKYWPNLSDAGFGINEDLAPSSLLTLLCLSLVLYLLFKREFKRVLLLLSPLLIFSIFVEWQGFVNRLYISGFAITGIFISYVATQIDFNFLKRAIRLLGFVSVVFVMLFVSFSGDRGFMRNSVLGAHREYEYFNQQPHLYSDYKELSSFIKKRGFVHIDLRSTENSWEYPLWAMNRNVFFAKGISQRQMYLCIDGCGGFLPKGKFESKRFGKTMIAYLN